MDAELRLGHGSEPNTTQGPLINTRAAEKVNAVSTINPDCFVPVTEQRKPTQR